MPIGNKVCIQDGYISYNANNDGIFLAAVSKDKAEKPVEVWDGIWTIEQKKNPIKQFKTTEGHSCRESFAANFGRDNEFLAFKNNNLNIEKLNEFFSRIDSKLQLEKQTILYPTNHANSVLIEVPRFWVQSEMRRSLFTLLVRLGAAYYRDSLKTAIKDYRLANDTFGAIERFFDGYHNPAGDALAMRGAVGWYHTFNRKTKEQLEKLMVK